LFFDLDDTICETDEYSEKYILNFFKTHKWPYQQIAKECRFAESKFDWPESIALAWYLEFGDKMMQFSMQKNAVKVINGLHDLGHKIVVATARWTDWHSEPEIITKV